jgi:hypothetical protein
MRADEAEQEDEHDEAEPGDGELVLREHLPCPDEHAARLAGRLEPEFGVAGGDCLCLCCHQYLTLGSSTA